VTLLVDQPLRVALKGGRGVVVGLVCLQFKGGVGVGRESQSLTNCGEMMTGRWEHIKRSFRPVDFRGWGQQTTDILG